MTNNNSFPSTEPPPHPGISNPIYSTANKPVPPEQIVDPKLASVMTINDPQNSFAPASTSSGASDTSQLNSQPLPPQKKGMPKILPIILGVFGILIIVTVVMFFLRRDRSINLVGTKGELVWWGVGNDESVVKPLIDEYINQNPNVKITYVKQSVQDYRERLINSLAQGKGPDIFEIHNSWVPMFSTELSSLPSSVMSIDEYKSTFYPVALQDFSVTKGVVAMPLEYDALTLFYNQNIFDSAAVVPPTTWDDVATLASNLTQKGERDTILQSGVALGITENVDYWQDIVGLMIFQNAANPGKPTTKTWDALSFFSSFTTDLEVWNTSLPNSISAFAKNKLAMLFAPTAAAKDIILEDPSFRFKTAILPQLPKNNPTDLDFSYATYWAQSVWVRSRNAEVAWDFLKFVSSAESLQKMNTIRSSRSILEKAYPRQEMAILQREDEVLGSVLALAKNARSWYLHDKTFDGQTGLNSQMANIYKDALTSVLENKDPEKLTDPLNSSINTVLTKYTLKN